MARARIDRPFTGRKLRVDIRMPQKEDYDAALQYQIAKLRLCASVPAANELNAALRCCFRRYRATVLRSAAVKTAHSSNVRSLFAWFSPDAGISVSRYTVYLLPDAARNLFTGDLRSRFDNVRLEEWASCPIDFSFADAKHGCAMARFMPQIRFMGERLTTVTDEGDITLSWRDFESQAILAENALFASPVVSEGVRLQGFDAFAAAQYSPLDKLAVCAPPPVRKVLRSTYGHLLGNIRSLMGLSDCNKTLTAAPIWAFRKAAEELGFPGGFREQIQILSEMQKKEAVAMLDDIGNRVRDVILPNEKARTIERFNSLESLTPDQVSSGRLNALTRAIESMRTPCEDSLFW